MDQYRYGVNQQSDPRQSRVGLHEPALPVVSGKKGLRDYRHHHQLQDNLSADSGVAQVFVGEQKAERKIAQNIEHNGLGVVRDALRTR